MLKSSDEAVFAELLFGLVEGFGYAVGVEGEDVPWSKLALDDGGVPLFEEAEDGRGGVEAFDGPLLRRRMAQRWPQLA